MKQETWFQKAKATCSKKTNKNCKNEIMCKHKSYRGRLGCWPKNKTELKAEYVAMNRKAKNTAWMGPKLLQKMTKQELLDVILNGPNAVYIF